MCQKLTLCQALSGCEGKRAQRQQSPPRPSFPAFSTLPCLYLAKHRETVIRIDPFFCGARRKTGLLETSVTSDFGAGGLLKLLMVPEPAMGAEENLTVLHALAVPSNTWIKENLESYKQVF